MNTSRNIARVQEMYAAFGRGDVPAIVEHFAEDIEWEYGALAANPPWLQTRHGRGAAATFFKDLTALDITRFEPKTFLESGNTVVVLIDCEATHRTTGRKFVEEDEVHIWHFNDTGKVMRFRHRCDTLQEAMLVVPQ